MIQVGQIPLKAAVLWFAAVIVFAAVACGTDEGGVASGSGGTQNIIERVLDIPTDYTIDDFKAAGVKAAKAYDVTDLPAADSAWHFIFNQKEFEVRFYPDHNSAIADGTEWADIVSGDNAVVVGDGVRWDEGSKDRRQCNRAASTPHSGCNYTARYGDFIIHGNMILLCEGKDPEEALKACVDILAVAAFPAA